MNTWTFRLTIALALTATTLTTLCPAEWGEVSKADQKVIDVLNARGDFDYKGVPLDDLLNVLEDQHKIEIVLSENELELSGIDKATPITFRAKGITLRSALRLMLSQLKMSHIVEDGVLQVTTQELRRHNRMHPIADLLSDDPDTALRESNDMIAAITETVLPDEWNCVGGPCSVTAVPPAKPRALLISGTHRMQDAVAETLAALRKAGNTKPDDMPVVITPTPGPVEAKVLKALDSAARFAFKDTPLTEVAEHIEKQYGINVLLDYVSLNFEDISPDTAISIDIDGVPLRVALKLMLRELELTFRVQDEVLLITTEYKEKQCLYARIYPLQNILPKDKETESLKKRQWYVDTLMYKIEETLEPDTWGSVGGPGSMQPLLLEKQDVLFIAQTAAVHRECAGLLSRKELRDTVWVRRKDSVSRWMSVMGDPARPSKDKGSKRKQRPKD